MSYHSELAAERGSAAPDDDAITAAERRGAREALTRLAEDIRVRWDMVKHDTNDDLARGVEWWRDKHAPAPTPAPREWWMTMDANGRLHDRTHGDMSERLVHVREVRPLTAAEVEALAQRIANACGASRGHAEARAALAHLNIPTED